MYLISGAAMKKQPTSPEASAGKERRFRAGMEEQPTSPTASAGKEWGFRAKMKEQPTSPTASARKGWRLRAGMEEQPTSPSASAGKGRGLGAGMEEQPTSPTASAGKGWRLSARMEEQPTSPTTSARKGWRLRAGMEEQPTSPSASAGKGRGLGAGMEEQPTSPTASAGKGWRLRAGIEEQPTSPSASAGKGRGLGAGMEEQPTSPTASAGKGWGLGAGMEEQPTSPTASAGKGRGLGAGMEEQPSSPTASAGKGWRLSAGMEEQPTSPPASAGKERIFSAGMEEQPTATAASAGTEWGCIKKIESSGTGKVKNVHRVAICNDGNITVVDCISHKAYVVYNEQYHRLTSPDKKEAKLIQPNDVAVTSNNVLVITDTSKYVKLFQSSGQYMRSICTLTQGENPDTKVETRCVAVSSQGFIVVGDKKRELITIHHETNNLFYNSIKTGIRPCYLEVTNKQNILVSKWKSRAVHAYNMESGKEVFVIDSWKRAGESGDAEPHGLASDSEGNVYIVVRKRYAYNDGHVHVYNEQGQYLQCIVKGLFDPCGLAWWNNSLYIADAKKGVKLYSSVQLPHSGVQLSPSSVQLPHNTVQSTQYKITYITPDSNAVHYYIQ